MLLLGEINQSTAGYVHRVFLLGKVILYCQKQAENGRKDILHTFHAAQPPFPNSVPCSMLFQEADIQGHQGQNLLHMEKLIWFIIFPKI